MRKDLTIPQQACQAIHAAYEAARLYPPPDSRTPTLVFLEVSDEAAILGVDRLLSEKRIQHVVFREPDLGNVPTAVATALLSKRERRILRFFPLWKGA